MRLLVAAAATSILALASAACGSSSNECQKLWTDAQSYVQNFYGTLPTPPSGAAQDQLARATLNATAAAHGISCKVTTP